MKIMIHSNAPFVPTGYGQQVRLLLPILKDLGHEPFVSAFYGLSGGPINWGEYLVLPSGQIEYGADVITSHAEAHGAELIITLMDFWKLQNVAHDLDRFNVGVWLPNDCAPVSRMDLRALAVSHAKPIAMSRFGQKNLNEAGFLDTPYIPHAVDTSVFKPVEDREALRAELTLDGKFIVGVCAANRDALRKAWPEQFEAFRRFHAKHKDTLLMVHSVPASTSGFNLIELARDLDIQDAVLFSDQYAQLSGLMTDQVMSDWFNTIDVLSLCSYAEAFGVPIIEAQACGTPVIVTEGSSMAELAGPGWKVKGQPFWNPMHRAYWTRPDVDRIVRAYEAAYQSRGSKAASTRSAESVAFAAQFDVHTVKEQYWKPALEGLVP